MLILNCYCISDPLKMPKHFRDCSFCSSNSAQHPDTVFFTLTNAIKSSLGLDESVSGFICEDHFVENDFKCHGGSKRLKHQAIPSYFPRLQEVHNDHDYVRTAPLNLVILIRWIIVTWN